MHATSITIMNTPATIKTTTTSVTATTTTTTTAAAAAAVTTVLPRLQIRPKLRHFGQPNI